VGDLRMVGVVRFIHGGGQRWGWWGFGFAWVLVVVVVVVVVGGGEVWVVKVVGVVGLIEVGWWEW